MTRKEILEKTIDFDDAIHRIVRLEKENAALKCECRTCVHTDSPCVRSDYPSKDGVCSHYKNVFERNAELKEKNRVLDCMLTGESLSSNERKHQLDKAIELILKLYNAGRDVLMCRTEEKAYDNLDNVINDKSIEQFLKECE